jgi:hypothetical protein
VAATVIHLLPMAARRRRDQRRDWGKRGTPRTTAEPDRLEELDLP